MQFTLTSASTTTQPFAIGFAFKQGDIPTGYYPVTDVTASQVNVLTRWPDGSAKWGVVAGSVGLTADTPATVSLEKVGGYTGGTGQPGSAMFKFGMGYGFIQGALMTLGARIELVAPQAWQKAMGCLTKGDKNVSKRRAQELFPTLKVTHATADALLIAEFNRRTAKP
jgi:hypothetical protein